MPVREFLRFIGFMLEILTMLEVLTMLTNHHFAIDSFVKVCYNDATRLIDGRFNRFETKPKVFGGIR